MHKKKLKNLLIAAAATGLVASLTVPNLTLSEKAWTYTKEDASESPEEEKDDSDKDKDKKKSEKEDPESKKSEKDQETKDSEKKDSEKKDSEKEDSEKEDSEKKDSEGQDPDGEESKEDSEQKESGKEDSGKEDSEKEDTQKKDQTEDATDSEKQDENGKKDTDDDSPADSAGEKDSDSSKSEDSSQETDKDPVKHETEESTNGKASEEKTSEETTEDSSGKASSAKDEKSDAQKAVAQNQKKKTSAIEKSIRKSGQDTREEAADESGQPVSTGIGLPGAAEEEKTQTPGSKEAVSEGGAAAIQIPVPTGEIVPSPVIYHPFRFWTVAKDAMYAAGNMRIYEEKSTSSRAVGTLVKDGVCYLLKEEKKDWYYVESGQVRGFVRKSDLITGKEAQEMTEERDGKKETLAKVLVPVRENEAFAYYRATVHQTVVEKDPALVSVDKLMIREAGIPSARAVGELKKGGLCYIIADRDKNWVYVESGQVRGFVPRTSLTMQEKKKPAATNLSVQEKEEEKPLLTKDESKYKVAKTLVEPEENKALYYTMTSIRTGASMGTLRRSILQYAQQFIGNPYVWGGTSLTEGADCSGFVQKIYAQYGFFLPRTSAEQAKVGKTIPVEEAMPGDLIFYGNGDRIYHVMIYAGNGKTIEAKSEKYGIVSAKVSYGRAVTAVRILDGDASLRMEIPDGLGSIHTYMGWQKITNTDSQQYAFRKSTGMTFDSEGFGVVDNRYVIACTTTFGNVGDYVDFYQEDGTVIPCVIGDIKSQNDRGCNQYGHLNGLCMVEFVVDQNTWYGNGHANPGTSSCHPEWHQNIVRVENVGNYYDKI